MIVLKKTLSVDRGGEGRTLRSFSPLVPSPSLQPLRLSDL